MARLLLDQNLSFRLAEALADLFPGSIHVRDVGLSRADDATVWQYARDNGLTLLTKDSDFNQMALLSGGVPKVVWLRIGNCSTDQALALVRRQAPEIAAFVDGAEEALLIIGE